MPGSRLQMTTIAMAMLAVPLARPAPGAQGIRSSWLWPREEVHRDGKVRLREESRLLRDGAYQRRRAEERAALAAADDPLQRARLHAKFMGRRLEEFAERRGAGIYSYNLLEGYHASALSALYEMRYARYLGRGEAELEALLEKVRGSLSGYLELLEELKGEVHPGCQVRLQGESRWAERLLRRGGRRLREKTEGRRHRF